MFRWIGSVFLLIQFFCSFLVLINNLSKQILSIHILHFITAHFTFITAQIGYHCTLKLGMPDLLVLECPDCLFVIVNKI